MLEAATDELKAGLGQVRFDRQHGFCQHLRRPTWTVACEAAGIGPKLASHMASWHRFQPFAFSPAPSRWWGGHQFRFQSEVRARSWEVSSLGRVKTLRGVCHYGSTRQDGYQQVFIDRRGYYVHRLVARAFHGPPPTAAHTHVHHMDGDVANNRANNLEYATPSQNAIHSWTAGTRRGSSCSVPLRCRPVEIGPWSLFSSQSEAARALGLWPSEVSRCCRGLRKHAGGYEFQKVEAKWLRGEVWLKARYPSTTDVLSNWMVSTHGRVQTTSGRITYGVRNGSGYFTMHYNRRAEGVQRTLRVHRMVAATFLGQPNTPDLHVNHKDGNRGNNRLSNLVYVTPAQNVQHAHFRRANRKMVKPNLRKPVLACEIGTTNWMPFESIQAAAVHTGAKADPISRVCCGRQSKTSNWLFRFADNDSQPLDLGL